MKKEMMIRLNTIQDVRNFVNIVSTCDLDIDLASGRYIVDAKSIMGIFSLDLLSPIALTIHGEPTAEFLGALKPFIVNE